jgi:hypothetical protein
VLCSFYKGIIFPYLRRIKVMQLRNTAAAAGGLQGAGLMYFDWLGSQRWKQKIREADGSGVAATEVDTQMQL